ncbi:MAG: helix-turn-helix transcriptional regulator [Blautia sp.]|jgi:DNA-binding CsgD family transcriptional regulator
MAIQSNNLAEDLYQMLLRCCSQYDPYNFCGQIVKELHLYVPYEQARILFIDVSGKISGSMLFGVSQNTWENFLDYYHEDLTGSRYSLKKPLHLSEKEKVSVCDWTQDVERKQRCLTFAEEYVRPLKLTYCLGLGLSDKENCVRSIITLDRTSPKPYTEDEILLIRKIHPLLERFFISLLLPAPQEFSAIAFLEQQFALTNREVEISELLCAGMIPADIGKRLCISVSTVYRHIANIYEKCHIKNRQELFQLFAKTKSPG